MKIRKILIPILLVISPIFLVGCDLVSEKINTKVNRFNECMKEAEDMAKLLKDWVCDDDDKYCFKLMRKLKPKGIMLSE